MLGGAPPSPALLARLRALNFRLVHVYGLTETYAPFTVRTQCQDWATLPVEEQDQLLARQGHARVVADPVRVVDAAMADVPRDGRTMGEVVMRGNIVMQGYYADPAATAEAFRGGWFHSGDLAVMHPDGAIELRDRKKDIIISGGENISTIEIEHALCAHSAVLECAVVAVPDDFWGERPKAFVILKPEQQVTSEELITFCRQHLAHFKCPAAVEFGELPKTSTGKVQKFVLREREWASIRQAHSLIPASDHIYGQGMSMMYQCEQVLAAIGSLAFRADPYPTYADLRVIGPVHRDEAAPIWHVVGYSEVHAALREPRLAAARSGYFLTEQQRREFDALARILPDMMVFADPPRHPRLRGLVTKAFTPRVVEGLRPRVQAIVDALIESVAPSHRMDVIADLAIPLPTTVIAALLGLPETDRDCLKAWSDDFATFIGGPTDHERNRRADAAIRDLIAYFTDAIARQRREPGDNLISHLIAVEERGQTLTSNEILATCVILLIGGHETTTNLIGNGLLALLRHPDHLRRLRHDLALIESAVEELLRYDSPVQMTTRLATDDLTLGGARIGQGELVKLWLGAANRDPAQFSAPDGLDLARADNRHLAFGYGMHFCVGAALARLEGQVALGTLVGRFPNLALTDEPLEYHGTQVFRALKRLPITM